jgi:hypothetical protein
MARLLCRELALQNEYLRLENRILKEKAQARGRVRFTDEERRSLTAAALALGHALMQRVVSIVKPEAILAWQRRLEWQRRDYSARRRPGRGVVAWLSLRPLPPIGSSRSRNGLDGTCHRLGGACPPGGLRVGRGDFACRPGVVLDIVRSERYLMDADRFPARAAGRSLAALARRSAGLLRGRGPTCPHRGVHWNLPCAR